MIKDIEISEVNEICGPYAMLSEYLNKEFLESDAVWLLDAVYLPTIRT